jgi:hypothetical protein
MKKSYDFTQEEKEALWAEELEHAELSWWQKLKRSLLRYTPSSL